MSAPGGKENDRTLTLQRARDALEVVKWRTLSESRWRELAEQLEQLEAALESQDLEAVKKTCDQIEGDQQRWGEARNAPLDPAATIALQDARIIEVRIKVNKLIDHLDYRLKPT